ncbi:unnamed protein product [Linum tenue]|uniref:Protein kinase domain-containing protein n=1 Tax=Linum tenue TaxID=586396 RepID=A0AAV0L0R6_9ROSI|nr:unnamed protein product [Linum tenue]
MLQNLLLSTNDNNAILKIADFGFARSLQPRGVAETLCGSPLYMAPEIMQLQKYDAKSVGAILFQLVTGKTPFTGSNQMQLLQNIMKSTELQFPPEVKLSAECRDLCHRLLRRNPVERLTFEEFFNHPFLSQRRADEPLAQRPSRFADGFSSSETNAIGRGSSQEDCLPFFLDDDSSGPDRSPSFSTRKPSIKTTYGFSLDARNDGRDATSNALHDVDIIASRHVSVRHQSGNSISQLIKIMFWFLDHLWMCLLLWLAIPNRTSQGSTDIGDALEQPSPDCTTRIKSLKQCASTITELVQEKIEGGRHLEAFSIQLVILAIWKQALHICHAQAASAIEGSPSQESIRLMRRSNSKIKHGTSEMECCSDDIGPETITTQIEREFLREVEHAEELANAIEPGRKYRDARCAGDDFPVCLGSRKKWRGR